MEIDLSQHSLGDVQRSVCELVPDMIRDDHSWRATLLDDLDAIRFERTWILKLECRTCGYRVQAQLHVGAEWSGAELGRRMRDLVNRAVGTARETEACSEIRKMNVVVDVMTS